MNLYKFNNKTLDFEPVIQPYIWRVLFVITSLFLLSSFLRAEDKSYIETEAVVLEKGVTEETVFEIIDRLPFKHPDIVKAQAILESANLKSSVFKHNNNLFGMKLPRQRLTLARGEDLNHAVYETVEDCIMDRLIYEAKYLHKLNREQYFAFLDKLYAEDGEYSQKLKTIIKQK